MAQYRTAQGKMIDMSAMATKNERVRAVGNMHVNARGDAIDSNNQVVKSTVDRTRQMYADTVTDAGPTSPAPGIVPQARTSPAKSAPPVRATIAKPPVEEMTQAELALQRELDDEENE